MGTVVVGAIVVVIAGLAVRSIVKDKKSGKGCNGNCGSCGGHCSSGFYQILWLLLYRISCTRFLLLSLEF